MLDEVAGGILSICVGLLLLWKREAMARGLAESAASVSRDKKGTYAREYRGSLVLVPLIGAVFVVGGLWHALTGI